MDYQEAMKGQSPQATYNAQCCCTSTGDNKAVGLMSDTDNKVASPTGDADSKVASPTSDADSKAANPTSDADSKAANPTSDADSKATYRTCDEKKALTNRLNRIEGQIRGLKGMLEKDAYCTDILTQSAAVTAAMNSFNKELLASHVRGCVARDIREGKDEVIDELVALLQKLMR